MDRILRFLNSNKELRKNLDKFLEAFVEFYGEESRAEIEEKFSKMLPIGYITPEELSRNLTKVEEAFTNKLFKELLNDKNTLLSKTDLTENYSLEYASLHPLYKYQKFYEAYCLGTEGRKKTFYEKGYANISSYLKDLTKEEYNKIIEEQRLPEKYQDIPQFLKNNIKYFTNEKSSHREYQKLYKDTEELLKKIIPEIKLSTFQDYQNDERLIELNKIMESYKSVCQTYLSFKESLKEFYDKDKLNSDSKCALQEKYHKKLIGEYKHLIPGDKRTNLEEYISGEKEDYTIDGYVKYLFGYSLFSELPLEFFTSKSENILTSDQESDWKKEEIIKGRIKYFKENGFDLGDDYKVYLENKSVGENWPSKELVDSFIAARNKCLNDYNNEFYTTTPDHQQIRSEIDSLNLLNKDDGFDASIYMNSGTFVTPNIRKNNNINELFSLLVISFDNFDDNFKDHFIVHELNHLYELYLELVGENGYTATCGWDIIVEDIHETPESVDTIKLDKEKRPYELFNEIINELIAQEISKIMHKNNIHIFDDAKTAKYKHATSYEHSLFLIKDFFYEFKDKIIESRKNGKIKVIWNEVGKDNFDELNSLFEIYNENFSGFKIYNLISDLKDNKDTKLTRIYYDLVDRKNNIMERMRMHQANKKEESYESQVTV